MKNSHEMQLLSQQYGDNDDIEYKYDNNGNITKAGNDTFTYDNLNRLRSVNGWPVSYSSTNPGNPETYRDTVYRFEGRRLKSVSEPMGIGEQKTVDYIYASNELIIKKVLGYCYDDDRDSEEFTTQYYYDVDKLVTEINPYCRLDFLYDENGSLYGLIKDNSSKFFYVRDYLHNILGIVDRNGKLIVKYSYDAYGNNKGIEDTSGIGIGSYNPFRYKGYYYDDDTEMYYCKSRFYVPKWRRWLNSDSINYLEPQNITCLNLFAYCNNNPVMYVDPSGNFTILGLLIGIGLSLLFEVIEDALDENEMDHDWRDYLGAGISGVFGALGGNVLMRGAFAIAGGLTDAWLFGDLEENGIGSVMVSIGISIGVSYIGGIMTKKISSSIKAQNLKSMNKMVARDTLEQMGLKRKIINYNLKDLSKSIYSSNWIGNEILSQIGSSVFGFASTIGYGSIMNYVERNF